MGECKVLDEADVSDEEMNEPDSDVDNEEGESGILYIECDQTI